MDDTWRFLYRARWIKSYDGDTPTMLLDLGLHTTRTVNIRVRDLWCPEVKGDDKVEGQRARDAARRWFRKRNEGDWPFLVEILPDSKGRETRSFTRFVADIYSADMESFRDWMVDGGWSK